MMTELGLETEGQSFHFSAQNIRSQSAQLKQHRVVYQEEKEACTKCQVVPS